MTVRLRPHHLLCLQTYAGKGYTPAFTANFDGIAARLAEGEAIVIVAGPDDICTPLLDEAEPHCWRQSVIERDQRALEAIRAQSPLPVAVGAKFTLSPALLRRWRASFAAGEARPACAGCEWLGLCGTIAAGGFRNVAIPCR